MENIFSSQEFQNKKSYDYNFDRFYSFIYIFDVLENLENIEKNPSDFKYTLENLIDKLLNILNVDFIIFHDILKTKFNIKDICKKLDLKQSDNLEKSEIPNYTYSISKSIIQNKVFKNNEIIYSKITFPETKEIVYTLTLKIRVNKKSYPFIVGNFNNKPISFQQYLLFKKVAQAIKTKLENICEKDFLKKNLYKDFLTKLYNRNFLKDVIPIELEKANRYNYPLSVIMLDLDNFKKVNDIKGHIFGDKILETIGQIIRKNIRKSDIPIRYGGDEFLIFLPNTKIGNALKIAKKLQNIIYDINFKLGLEENLNFGVSGGVLEVKKFQDIDSLIDEVDKLLYISKNQGKGKIVFE